MNREPATSNGAVRPMHPMLKNVLVFIVGALFGAVCVFIFVTLHPLPMPQALPCPQVPIGSTALASGAEPMRLPESPITFKLLAPPANATQTAIAAPASTPAPAIAPTTTPSDSIPAPNVPPGERPSASLLIPVAGVVASQLTDTFTDARSAGRRHDAIDIMAPKGTRVLAADDGRIAKLFYSKLGGITLYEFDPSERFVYYYAHLDSYAPGMIEGKQVHRGDLLGFVGSSGDANAAAPHLHFAISVLAPEKHWWQATAVNPYPLLVGHR